ncbi:MULTISPECIES: site-specific integrase [Mycobacteriaceae]|uniref:tyrosine-type recombinase/integrase n=1 Tax=Mycobacteriaceae TaxID=1762 RepID=UPI0009E8D226|nr:site-specific integrase [Mycolicibacterium mucogenicum]
MKIPSYVTVREFPSGRRYEVRLEVTGPNGARHQRRRRFRTLKEAIDAHATVTAERAAGTCTAPSQLTVKAACEQWLAGKRIKPTTHAAYTAALAPVIEKYGDRPVQKIVKADVEKLVVELRDGTGPRGLWARTSINPMLARWRSVWKDLQAQGILPRNVIDLVEPLRRPSGAPDLKLDDVLSEVEVEQLVDAHAVSAPPADAAPKVVREIEHAHLRELFVHLALPGLRRGELAGLRWSAITLDAEVPTLAIRATRVSTAQGVIEQDDAKTLSSARELDVPPHLIPILRRVRREQRTTRLVAGELWEGPNDGYVIAHPYGRPVSPRALNAWWNRSLMFAGVPHRRLHASRHTAATLLHLRGAPTATIAA